MTKENSLRLLKHFKEIGNTEGYKDLEANMIKLYGAPEPSTPTKETKSKGKK